jgi:hypothetical protein
VNEPVHESKRDKAIWQQEHQLWDIDKVKSVVADHSRAISFFCGGSRNFSKFIDLFDGVFVLEVADLDTLYRRLVERVAQDPTDFSGKPEERNSLRDCPEREKISRRVASQSMPLRRLNAS